MLKKIGRKLLDLQFDNHLHRKLKKKSKRVINFANVKRFLCLQLNSIGDTIMTQPSWARLKSCVPEAEIDLVCQSHIIPLYEADGAINRIYGFEKKPLSLCWNKPNDNFKEICLRGDYDVIIDFTALPLSSALCANEFAPPSVGFRRIFRGNNGDIDLGEGYDTVRNYHDQVPVREMMMQLVDPWVPENDHSHLSSININSKTEQTAGKLLQNLNLKINRYIVLQPGAKWPPRKWPVDKWISLIRELSTEFGESILLLGGPGDERFIGKIVKETDPSSVKSHITSDIQEFAGLIKKALICICHDSAAMHIAAAVGTRSVAIFGPGAPYRTAPGKSEGCKTLYEDLFCNPCTQYYSARRCRRGVNFCMQKIHVLTVYNEILSSV